LRDRVGVLIPVYNGIDFIAKALDSVLYQSYKISSIIVVDDESSDSTASFIEENYKSVVLIKKNNQEGPAAARNFALTLDNLDWITFLDADDWWTKNKIEKQLDFATNNSADFVWCNGYYSIKNNLNKPIYNYKDIENTYKLNNGIVENIFGFRKRNAFSFPSASFFNKKSFDELKGFNKDLKYSNDYDFFVRAYCEGYKLAYMKDKLFYYYVSSSDQKMSNQTIGVVNQQQDYWYNILDNYIKEKKPDLYNSFCRSRISITCDMVYSLTIAGLFRKGFLLLWKQQNKSFRLLYAFIKGLFKYLIKKIIKR